MRPTRTALVLAASALAPALLMATPSFAADTAAPAVTTATATAAPQSSDDQSPYDRMSEEELRAEIERILDRPESGKAVHREGTKALEGTADDMRAFLKNGYRGAQWEDDRVAIATILGKPDSGVAVREAA
ncbi:ALF repeat-containing protein, partial [Streptomyces thermoviolaceus]